MPACMHVAMHVRACAWARRCRSECGASNVNRQAQPRLPRASRTTCTAARILAAQNPVTSAHTRPTQKGGLYEAAVSSKDVLTGGMGPHWASSSLLSKPETSLDRPSWHEAAVFSKDVLRGDLVPIGPTLHPPNLAHRASSVSSAHSTPPPPRCTCTFWHELLLPLPLLNCHFLGTSCSATPHTAHSAQRISRPGRGRRGGAFGASASR